MKKLISLPIAAFLTLVLAGGGHVSASADQTTWNEGQYAEDGYSLVAIWENIFAYPVRRVDTTKANGTRSGFWCAEGFGKNANCDPKGANKYSVAHQIIPVCENSKSENCLEALSFKKDGGNEVEAEFLKYAGGPEFPADPAYGLYEGSYTSLWRAPGFYNSYGTDTFAVTVRDLKQFDSRLNKFKTWDVEGSINGYYEIPGSQYQEPEFTDDGMRGGGGDSGCVWVLPSLCGMGVDLDADTEIKLVVRVSNEISGWFKGRLNNPVIDVEKFSKSNVRLTISSKPARVARFLAKEKAEYFTPKIRSLMKVETGSAGASGPKGHSFLFPTWPTDRSASHYVEFFRSKVKDTASGMSSIWNFGTVNYGSGSSCLKDSTRVLGIVTTNATAYGDYAPKFEKGFLTYSVTGLHYEPDGTSLNLGTYDFIMRSDVARCLYGLGKTPISASISVVTDKGVKTTATTLVSEKNGWLKLRAAGFTFSKKTIKVKITKKK